MVSCSHLYHLSSTLIFLHILLIGRRSSVVRSLIVQACPHLVLAGRVAFGGADGIVRFGRSLLGGEAAVAGKLLGISAGAAAVVIIDPFVKRFLIVGLVHTCHFSIMNKILCRVCFYHTTSAKHPQIVFSFFYMSGLYPHLLWCFFCCGKSGVGF